MATATATPTARRTSTAPSRSASRINLAFVARRGLLRLARRLARAARRRRPQPRRRARPGPRLGRRLRRPARARRAPHLRLEAGVDPRRVRQLAAPAGRDRLARLGGGRPARGAGADRRRRRHGRRRGRHRRQRRDGAALPARPPRRPQRARRLPAHGRRRRGLGRRRRRRGADARASAGPGSTRSATLAIALVILLGTWGLFRDSLHLMFDGVPASIDLEAVRAELAALPGVARVSDLHVWATGTTEVALTAHLVMPAGHPDDAFFRDAAARLQERFAIGHVTLQAATEALMAPCDARRCRARPRAACMKYKDYYETLGVPRDGDAGRDQAGLPQARPQVPPRRQQGGRRRGALQGDQRGQRGPEGSREARRLRPDGQQLEGGPGVPAAAELGRGLRVPRRRRLRRSATAAPAARASTPATSSRALFGRRAGTAGAAAGPRRRASVQGEDHHAKVLIDIEDSYRGAERQVTLRAAGRTAPTAASRCRSARSTSTSRRASGPASICASPARATAGTGGAKAGDLYLEIAFDAAPVLPGRRRRRLRRPAARALGSGARRQRRRADARGHAAADGARRARRPAASCA